MTASSFYLYPKPRLFRQSSRRLLNGLQSHLLRMLLRIKLKHPILSWKLNGRWVLLYLLPIRMMPHIPRRLPRLLHRLHPLIPDILIRPQRTPNIILTRLPQQYRDRDAIFQRLRRALCTRRQERMRGIA